MSAYLDRPASGRAVSFGVVALLHIAVIALVLSQSGRVRSVVPLLAAVTMLPAERRPPPPPPPPIVPKVIPPDMMVVPMPEISVAPPPPSSRAPTAIVRVGPKGPPVSHFGAAAGDTGLGVSVATAGTGGAQGRGSLEDFEAAG